MDVSNFHELARVYKKQGLARYLKHLGGLSEKRAEELELFE